MQVLATHYSPVTEPHDQVYELPDCYYSDFNRLLQTGVTTASFRYDKSYNFGPDLSVHTLVVRGKQDNGYLSLTDIPDKFRLGFPCLGNQNILTMRLAENKDLCLEFKSKPNDADKTVIIFKNPVLASA